MKVTTIHASLLTIAAISLIGCATLVNGNVSRSSDESVPQEAEGTAVGDSINTDLALRGDTLAVLPSVFSRSADSFVAGLSLFYIPLSSQTILVPADVGQAESAVSERVIRQFRAEYERVVASFVPLTGVLGADRLHRWTNKTRDGSVISALVQNWQSRVPLRNGFGLPHLVLAMDGGDGEAVYCIFPPILDIYSQNLGTGRAAGLAGYGKPMTGSFLMLDGESYIYAQRFSGSLIRASLDTQGRSAGQLTLEPAPSLTALPPDMVGLLQDGTKNEYVIKAWLQALDQGFPKDAAGKADGPAVNLDTASAEGTQIVVQTFDGGRWAIVQAGRESDPVLVSPPFMDLFVSGKTDYSGALARVISAYGFPIANAYAVPLAYLLQSSEVKTVLERFIRSDNPYVPLLVQRFQRGLWVAVPRIAVLQSTAPKAD